MMDLSGQVIEVVFEHSNGKIGTHEYPAEYSWQKAEMLNFLTIIGLDKHPVANYRLDCVICVRLKGSGA